MNWRKTLKEQYTPIGDKELAWFAPSFEKFISTEIIGKLIQDMYAIREGVRECKSPRSVTEPPSEVLKEARLIQRGDALDAFDKAEKKLKSKWL